MKPLILIFFCIASFLTSAQTAFEALSFSREANGGTARYTAMGGAFNALGGDFSTLSINPAGLAIYRSSEFTLTPTLDFVKTETDPEYDYGIADTKGNFNISNLGYVSTRKTGKEQGLLSYNFGFGFNRTQTFHKSYRINNPGVSYSLTDAFAQNLQDKGKDGAAWGAQLGHDSYLINESLDGNTFGSPLIEGAKVDYVKDVVEKGRINEWLFAVGGNIDNTLFLGASIGLRDIKQEMAYAQEETFLNNKFGEAYLRPDPIYGDTAYYSATDKVPSAGFLYNSAKSTDGFGINLKFGVIFVPLDFWRVGFAVHTPSYNWLNVNYSGELLNDSYYIVTSPKNEYYGEEFYGQDGDYGYRDYFTETFSYRIVSPYKVNLSSAFIVGKLLAIDVEGDIIGYNKMKVKDADDRAVSSELGAVNKDIEDMYKTSCNLRIGAEARLGKAFSLRGGYAFYGSPYKREKDNFADYIGNRHNFSGGLGYKAGDFFMDFAYVHAMEKGNTFVYDDASDAYMKFIANTEMRNNRFMMTLGFKF